MLKLADASPPMRRLIRISESDFAITPSAKIPCEIASMDTPSKSNFFLPYTSESSPKIGAAKNCTIPKSAVARPARKYQYCLSIPVNRNDVDVGSVKIIGMMGITIPIPTISRTRVKNKMGRALFFIGGIIIVRSNHLV